VESTEGFVVIGPGSEWFWIALQFFALAGTFYAIYRQLRAQQREIRESTKAQLSLGYNNAIRLGQRPLEMLIEDDKLARIATVGYATPDNLNAADWTRFGNFMFLQFNAWEFFYYQHQDRQIPKTLWVGADNYYRNLIETSPGLSRFWAEFDQSYDEPFRSYVIEAFAARPTGVVA
jgi:hypothetical protein